MSVIVIKRIAENKGFIVGADSQITTHGQRKKITPGCKLFHPDGNEDIVVGIVGSLRDANVIQVIEDLLDFNAIRRESLTLASIVNHTVDKIQQTLRKQGRLLSDQGQWVWDSSIIVAHKDKAFTIDSDFCVQEVEDFESIGAPSEYVHGAKVMLDNFIKSRKLATYEPEEIVENSIRMTIELTNTVDYPIVMMDTENNKTWKIEK